MDLNTGIKDQARLMITKNMPEFGVPIIDMMITTLIFVFLSNWINKFIDLFDNLKSKLIEMLNFVIKKIFNPYSQISLVGTKTTINKSREFLFKFYCIS